MPVGTAVVTGIVQATAQTFTMIPSSMANIVLNGNSPMWWNFNGSANVSGTLGIAPLVDVRIVVDGTPGPIKRITIPSGTGHIAANFVIQGVAGAHTGWVEWMRATGTGRRISLQGGQVQAIGLEGAVGPTGPAGPSSVSYSYSGTASYVPVVLAPSAPTGLVVEATDIAYDGDAFIKINENIKTVITRNATPTAVISWIIGSGTVEMVDIAVTAIASGGSLAATFKQAMSVRNQSGTPTIFGGVDSLQNHSAGNSANWGLTMTYTGATGIAYVFGTATATINWHAVLRRQIGKYV